MMQLAIQIERGLGLLARLFSYLAAVAMFAIVGIILASVVMRHVVGSPLYYTEELVGLLLGASLFLALPMVTHQADHVRVTFLVQFVSDKGRAVLAILAGAVTLAFCVWFLVEAIPWLEFAFKRNIKTEAASIRLGPWMAVLPISISLAAMLVLVRVVTGSERASFNKTSSHE